VAFGLVYLLVWESLLADYLSGTRMFSVQQYALAVADRVAPSPLVEGAVSLPLAITMSVVVTVAATVLATERLRSFSLRGEAT
jgi:ABC-2 type transport system permease protein